MLAKFHYAEYKAGVSKLSLQILSYHTNLIQFAALVLLRKSNEGGATEDNNCDFLRGSPTELFLYLISLVDMVSFPLAEGNNRNSARGSPHQALFFFFSTLLIVLQKIKALPEGGQQLNSKYAIAQGQVLILRRILIPY